MSTYSYTISAPGGLVVAFRRESDEVEGHDGVSGWTKDVESVTVTISDDVVVLESFDTPMVEVTAWQDGHVVRRFPDQDWPPTLGISVRPGGGRRVRPRGCVVTPRTWAVLLVCAWSVWLLVGAWMFLH